MHKLILRCAKYYWTFIGSSYFKGNRPDCPPKRILITKFDRLGDFFLLIPFLQQLQKRKIEIVLISPPMNKEVIDHLQIPVSFIPFDNSSIEKFSELLRFVRETSFSHAINLSMNIWGGFLVNQSKSAHKLGLLQEREHYVYKGAKLFYDKILSYPPDTHNFDVLCRVFGEITGEDRFFPLIEKKTTDNGWIVIHPFASWKPKQWPKFFELMENLTEQNYKVKVIGTPKEYQDFIVPKNLQNNPSVSFTVLSSVKELMEQIDSCTAFIGNDSGPAHYAALIGKPTTIIWGPGLFERIHARGKNVHFCIVPVNCRPCRQKGVTCQRGNNICLQNVTVEMVLEKFESSLNKHVNHSDRSSDTPL
ncbi:MAG: glycosyltransferase family 9 protein [Fibrobacter sp.]|jgi:ADP-heptose:LPS heptosyltransferase|nr:glycosyltransferase family 9 protein [Fibrobacter sp.]